MKYPLLVSLFAAAVNFLQAQPIEPKPTDAESTKLTPEQTATIIKQLDALEATFGKNRAEIIKVALTRCSNALAAGESGALQLYMDCYKLEHFDRTNAKASEFQEWAKKNIEKHKDPEFLMALWLQLDYFTLCIKAQDAQDKDVPSMVAALQSFIPRMVAAIQGTTKHTGADSGKASGGKGNHGQSFDADKLLQMLRQSVKNSEFAKAFQLDPFLKKENWTYDPLDIRGMYDKVIFPYYIEQKPKELPAQWDNRIKSELSIKAATMNETEYADFYKEHYPGMVWRKSEHLVSQNVNTILAMADMLKLIRENPSHPEVRNWAKRLRELVVNMQPPGGPSATETTSDTPPPTKTN
ncbi:MAG: hypothetical protein K8R87_14140 [Verrucomicrobia bacterium]|nr:hypothetical protein [Verrucomicrobiota bacterium]